MGLLTMKYTEAEMYRMLEGGLLPGERLTAAVYCSYQETKLLASNTVQAGYIGLTDSGRLIGIRSNMLQTVPFAVELHFLQKIKVKKGLLGSRNVLLESPFGKLKFVVTPKVAGGKFPHHTEYFQKILETLEAKQAQLQ